MGGPTIEASEFVRDFKSRMDDDSLMGKYGLSSEQLQRIFRELSQYGLLTDKEIDSRATLTESQITRAFVESEREKQEIA
jgi:hypothetical protein